MSANAKTKSDDGQDMVTAGGQTESAMSNNDYDQASTSAAASSSNAYQASSSHTGELETAESKALTTLKPPAPYAEDVVDDEAGPSKELTIPGAQDTSSLQHRQGGEDNEDHMAAVAAAAAAAASAQDEEEARSLETQMRLAKGQRDAMNAVMQLAHAAANNNQHGMPAELQAHLQAQQQKASGSSTTAASTAGKRKRDEQSQPGRADDGNVGSSSSTATTSALQAPSAQAPFQWSPEAQESFAKLFGNVSDMSAAGRAQTEAGAATTSQQLQGDTSMTDAEGKDGGANEGANAGAQADTGGQDPDTSTLTEEETTAELIARNGRALNPSKRAAQNRAAQRAFRLRREEHVREIEDKAKRTDEAERNAEHYKQRLEDALQTIETLRADNHSLRIAIEAVGLHAPTSAPAATTPATTSTGESKDATIATQDDAPAPTTNETTQAHDTDAQSSENAPAGLSEKTAATNAAKEEELGGLSAVAAAAAAAAAMGQAQGDNAQTS